MLPKKEELKTKEFAITILLFEATYFKRLTKFSIIGFPFANSICFPVKWVDFIRASMMAEILLMALIQQLSPAF